MQPLFSIKLENAALRFVTLCALKLKFTSIMFYQSVCLNNSWSLYQYVYNSMYSYFSTHH